jgi:biotin-(acetyl-CoA carboxylase) ligase
MPRGSVTTVQIRTPEGDLAVSKRVTVTIDGQGVETATVETLNTEGQLAVAQTTSKYQNTHVPQK